MTINDIETYYNRGREQARLTADNGQLERLRTQEIILRYLPKPPATIYDIGGGAGTYALWLAQLGYEVHLLDLMWLHIEQANKAAEAQPDHPLASARVGDALRLDFADASADVVLLLGPLYHLTERTDRIRALREAYRILKPGGVVVAATISRYASFLDGLFRGFLADEYFAELTERDLINGQHRNPKGIPGYFATAYFHHPTEIAPEVAEAGFSVDGPIAIEGPVEFKPEFDQFWSDDKLRERVLNMLRTFEREPSMLGATGHMITVGWKHIADYAERRARFLSGYSNQELRFFETAFAILEALALPIKYEYALAWIYVMHYRVITLIDGTVLDNDPPYIGSIEDYSRVIAIMFATINVDPIWWKASFPSDAFGGKIGSEIQDVTAKLKQLPMIKSIE